MSVFKKTKHPETSRTADARSKPKSKGFLAFREKHHPYAFISSQAVWELANLGKNIRGNSQFASP